MSELRTVPCPRCLGKGSYVRMTKAARDALRKAQVDAMKGKAQPLPPNDAAMETEAVRCSQCGGRGQVVSSGDGPPLVRK